MKSHQQLLIFPRAASKMVFLKSVYHKALPLFQLFLASYVVDNSIFLSLNLIMMNHLIIACFFLNALSACAQDLTGKDFQLQQYNVGYNTNIRAIVVLNDSVCWFAGSKGIFGYTENGGVSWNIDSVKIDTLIPEFRAMALLDDQTVLLLNIGSPAFILKTTNKGKTWRRVYNNTHKQIFFDAMQFADSKNGIAIADPIDSNFVIVRTTDGGDSWQQLNAARLPKAYKDEAFFASSNSNISYIGKRVRIASGGSHARVLISDDAGFNWKIIETPISSGKQMTGIYSMDFCNTQIGIIAGGDYDTKLSTANTKAITSDGGLSWKAVSNNSLPGFISCVKYQPGKNCQTILVSCLPGIFISDDGGVNWKIINEQASYYTFNYSPTGKVAWLAGARGTLAKMTFKY